MRLSLVDSDVWASELPEVTSPKIFESGKYAREGLFSQQIFGPVKSYSCPYKKPTCNASRMRSGEVCKVCGVEITTSEVRRKRFAKIELPFEILNPIFYYIITNAKMSSKRILMDMLSYKHSYYYNENGDLIKIVDDKKLPRSLETLDDENTTSEEDLTVIEEIVKENEEKEILVGLKGALKYISNIIESDTREDFIYIKNNYDKITVKNIIVIPPDFRPIGKNETGNRLIADDINGLYAQILVRSNNMKNLPFTVDETDEIFKANFWNVQVSTMKLYEFVLKKLSKKTGLIRENILGKRLDFSGRAVITPDPTLSIEECGLPYNMILEIFKPQLVAYMITRKLCKRYNQASKIIEDCLKEGNFYLMPLVEDFCKNKVCVLNRQPTLHRLGMIGFNIVPHLGNTIKLHPMVCPPFNADFDGDAMAVYIPITDESIRDVINKVHIRNNLLSPTNISIIPTPNQDIILGIFAATKEDTSNRDKVEYKGLMLSVGRCLFNKCLPDSHPVIDKELDEKELKSILNNIALKYPPKVVIDTVDKIKKLGFNLSTLEGYTLSLDQLYDERFQDITDKLAGNYDMDKKAINSREVHDLLMEMPFSDYIESGARGNWDQAKQLVFTRGYVADSTNKVRKDHLIRSSLVSGLSPKEFFDSSWGARKGLLDTALTTGETGYLTRQMIYSSVSIELGEVNDCGTTDTLDIDLNVLDKDGKFDKIKSIALARTLLWRYYVDDKDNLILITKKEVPKIIGKKIRLRSPIYCKSQKTCKTCYGNLHKVLHSDQIGIIATQSICERATQLVLRTFHVSGVVSGESEGGKNEDIISGMSIANKVFHKPEDLGKIDSPSDMVMMIYKVFGQYGGIHLVHYEVIASAMMWSGNRLWRLLPDRDTKEYKWTSILKIPALSSWLLGAAFSNVKSKIIDGLIRGRVDTTSSLTSLFRL